MYVNIKLLDINSIFIINPWQVATECLIDIFPTNVGKTFFDFWTELGEVFEYFLFNKENNLFKGIMRFTMFSTFHEIFEMFVHKTRNHNTVMLHTEA